MERAGRVLGKLKLASACVSDEQLATAAWPVAVGKKLALRTNAVGLVRDRLVVEVEDAVWQRQLWTMRDQILQLLDQALGRRIVQQLEFKIAVPKRGPARAETGLSQTDEADLIKDPVFRTVYKAARKKANA